MTRLLVFGGRSLQPGDTPGMVYQAITNFCFDRIGGKPSCVIEGGADGYDTVARLWAQGYGIPVETYKADWYTHGRAAGPIRNGEMLRDGKPDLGLAFPGGRGTANMMAQARNAGLEVVEIE